MATKRETRVCFEDANGRTGYRIRFYDAAGKRRSIWLGNETEATATVWRNHVDHLTGCLERESPLRRPR